MRAAAILGLGCSAKNPKPFQTDGPLEWVIGLPSAADQADVILLFGGDGTIHRHLSQLARLGLPVLIGPAGSGNDFARALGLRNVRDALAAWRRFCSGQNNVRAIDLGTLTSVKSEQDHYFCSVAGIGLDAEVSRRANTLPRWLRGHGGYALALAPTLLSYAPRAMKIMARDEAGNWATRSDQTTMLAAFGNTATYGGGMKIAPNARADDGLLDVCVIGGNRFKLACMFPTVYFGRHLRIREVNYFQAPSIRVETISPLDVYADGEFICRTPVEIGVQSGALRIVTP
jgi:diacylglycerol kinase (ATP)